MRLRTFVPAAAATLLAAGTAAAQTDTAMAADSLHDNSLAVEVNGSPSIGVWHRFSPNVEAGLEVSAHHGTSTFDNGAASQESTVSSYGVGPAVKLYTGPAGSFRPYVYGNAGVSFVNVRDESGSTTVNEQKAHAFFGALALGLEWRVIPRVSIGAHAGLEGSVGRRSVELVSSPDGDQDDWHIGTFTSGLRAQLYF